MPRRRYTKRRCRAKTGDGKPCRKFALEDTGACGIKSHQRQVAEAAARKSATPSRARTRQKQRKPDPKVVARQRAFLKAYRETGTILRACQATRVDRKRHYEWLEDPRYPEYAREFELADADAVDVWEDELIRRTTKGTEKVTTIEKRQPGVDEEGNPFELVATETRRVHEYSDSLFPLLMKGRRRRVYNPERQTIKHEGIPTGPAPRVVLILPDNKRGITTR